MSLSHIYPINCRRCPRCGSTLLTDGVKEWCTFVGTDRGPRPEKPCTYGIDARVYCVVVPEREPVRRG